MKRMGVREARRLLCSLLEQRGRLLLTVRGRDAKALVEVEEAKLLEAMERAGTLDDALAGMEDKG